MFRGNVTCTVFEFFTIFCNDKRATNINGINYLGIHIKITFQCPAFKYIGRGGYSNEMFRRPTNIVH